MAREADLPPIIHLLIVLKPIPSTTESTESRLSLRYEPNARNLYQVSPFFSFISFICYKTPPVVW